MPFAFFIYNTPIFAKGWQKAKIGFGKKKTININNKRPIIKAPRVPKAAERIYEQALDRVERES